MLKKTQENIGLNINYYLSNYVLVQPSNLSEIKGENYYHIYAIISVPKAYICENTLIMKNKKVTCYIYIKNKGIEKKEHLKNVLIPELQNKNIGNCRVTCKRPFSSIIVNYSEGKFTKKLVYSSSLLYINSKIKEDIDFKILYIGQSYGNNGERLASDRLKNHETLQKILSDNQSKEEPDEVIIMYMHFERDNSLIIPAHQKYTDNELFSKFESMEFPFSNDQIINLIEAGLINYFKPLYNNNFTKKGSFPSKKHKSYQAFYDKGFDSFTIEINPFDMMLSLYTDNSRLEHGQIITYSLTDEGFISVLESILNSK